MTIDAGRDGIDESTDAASGETPGEAATAAHRIDLDRLVWDPEYRQNIKVLLKHGEAP